MRTVFGITFTAQLARAGVSRTYPHWGLPLSTRSGWGGVENTCFESARVSHTRCLPRMTYPRSGVRPPFSPQGVLGSGGVAGSQVRVSDFGVRAVSFPSVPQVTPDFESCIAQSFTSCTLRGWFVHSRIERSMHHCTCHCTVLSHGPNNQHTDNVIPNRLRDKFRVKFTFMPAICANAEAHLHPLLGGDTSRRATPSQKVFLRKTEKQ